MERFKNHPHYRELLNAYRRGGWLTNASLSVHPDRKLRWRREYGCTHELFGAFYNVFPGNTYCSLFPAWEGSMGKAEDYVPPATGCMLVNPPYTEPWIRWCIRNLETNWKGSALFVIPVWDIEGRRRLGLSLDYGDLPLTNLKRKATWYRMETKFPFWNGITGKDVFLKDPVYVFYFRSLPLL